MPERKDPSGTQRRELGHIQQIQRNEAHKPGRRGQSRAHTVAPASRLLPEQRDWSSRRGHHCSTASTATTTSGRRGHSTIHQSPASSTTTKRSRRSATSKGSHRSALTKRPIFVYLYIIFSFNKTPILYYILFYYIILKQCNFYI